MAEWGTPNATVCVPTTPLSSMPPPLVSKKRARLPRLLQKLFLKVLGLRWPPPGCRPGTRFEAYGRYRFDVDDEYCSYGGASCSSWPGALTSIPEEGSEKGSPEAGPGAIQRTCSERLAGAGTAVASLEVVL